MASSPPQAERLRDALKQTKLSKRRLAVLLQEQQPDRSLENVRSQLNKWIKSDTKGWTDESAERLSAAFKAAGHNFPASYFVKDPNRSQTWSEQMAELAAWRVETDSELAKLRREIGRLRRQAS